MQCTHCNALLHNAHLYVPGLNADESIIIGMYASKYFPHNERVLSVEL